METLPDLVDPMGSPVKGWGSCVMFKLNSICGFYSQTYELGCVREYASCTFLTELYDFALVHKVHLPFFKESSYTRPNSSEFSSVAFSFPQGFKILSSKFICLLPPTRSLVVLLTWVQTSIPKNYCQSSSHTWLVFTEKCMENMSFGLCISHKSSSFLQWDWLRIELWNKGAYTEL